MKKRFTEEEFIKILKDQEAGDRTADACRRNGVSQPTFYKWKAKFGDIEVSDARKRPLGTRRPMQILSAVNVRWSLDFVSDAFTDGRRFRILALSADTSLSGSLIVRELQALCEQHGYLRTIVSRRIRRNSPAR